MRIEPAKNVPVENRADVLIPYPLPLFEEKERKQRREEEEKKNDKEVEEYGD